MSSKKKTAGLYILSFVIPMALMTLACLAMGITPFGNNTLLVSDSNSLYINCISYMKRLMHGQESLFYSFSKDIGGNVLSIFAWHLSNPFYMIFYFFDLTDFAKVFTFTSLLQLSACGTTMFHYLRRRFGDRWDLLIFSCAYALCGYNAVNCWQLMWINGVMILPLVALGIRYITEKKSPALYMISLAYAVLTNFYIGFGICLFSVLYFVVQLYEKRISLKRNPGIPVAWAFSSLAGGLIPAFMWVPTVLSLRGGRLGQTKLEDFAMSENMPFLEMGAKLFTGASSTEQLSNGLPNIYVTMIVVALVVMFFMNRAVERRHRLGEGFLIGAYILSFYIVAFTSVFQGFSHANWFNYRYSFALCFILIAVGAEEFGFFREFSLKDIRRTGMGIVAAAVLVFSKEYEFITAGSVLLDLILLLLVYGAYRLCMLGKKERKRLFTGLFGALVCLSLFLNYVICTCKVLGWAPEASKFEEEVSKAQELVETVQASDDGFYRMENEYSRTGNCGNDPIMFGYYGTGSFSSTERKFVLRDLARLGIGRYDMRNCYDKGTPAAMDSLLGIKYLLSTGKLSVQKNYAMTEGIDGTDIYENPYVLPIAIASAGTLEDIDIDEGSVFDLQNELWCGITGEDMPVFTEVSDITYTSHDVSDVKTYETGVTKKKSHEPDEKHDTDKDYYIEYSFTAEKNEPIYMHMPSQVSTDSGSKSDVLRYIGTFEPGETVTGKIYFKATIGSELMQEFGDTTSFCYENLELLSLYSGLVKFRDCTVQQDKGNEISGTVRVQAEETAGDIEAGTEEDDSLVSATAGGEQTVLLTIPWDEGWKLYVDGEPAAITRTADLFMSFSVGEGKHTWRMVYTPEGFEVSAVISLAALAAGVLLIVVCRVCASRRSRSAQTTGAGNSDAEESGTGGPVLPEISEDKA